MEQDIASRFRQLATDYAEYYDITFEEAVQELRDLLTSK